MNSTCHGLFYVKITKETWCGHSFVRLVESTAFKRHVIALNPSTHEKEAVWMRSEQLLCAVPSGNIKVAVLNYYLWVPGSVDL
jgi:hypothetical protein